jgi:hypothetical protein
MSIHFPNFDHNTCPLSKAEGFKGRKEVKRLTDMLAKFYEGPRVAEEGLRRK